MTQKNEGFVLQPEETIELRYEWNNRISGQFFVNKINDLTIKKMLELMFPSKMFTKSEFETLKEFILFEFSHHRCVVLYKPNSLFSELVKNMNLGDIEKREVVLLSDGKTIKFSNDYYREAEVK